ncbi:MAG: acyl-CoA dehydrogenase family protein [Leptospiraceae bacterium]|nr:acyl-CoA dehydrogenase family protein [Leptospiraceae bacterium]
MKLSNTALEPFDISEYKGISGKNFYLLDTTLQKIINHYSKEYDVNHKKSMEQHIEDYGALVGGILNELTIACNKEGKYGEVEKYDRVGNRIDMVIYSPEQIESRRISYKYGIVNLDFHKDWKYAFTDLHRYALTYLTNMNGEGGVACPLAMTDGIIRGIKALGTDSIKEKFLQLVAGEDSNSYFMAGQYVTERVGGSNVGANRTRAKKIEDGKWILNGEKWFCSNPGDLWVTTAKLEDSNTIGMFLVPRIKEDGTLNGCHILRKKDIIGSRGKITVETIYEDLEAYELGRPSHGLANLIQYIIQTSRIHVSLGSIGMASRSYFEALEYVKTREAYGNKVIEFPSIQKNLAEMRIYQTTCMLTTFRVVSLMEKKSSLLSLLNPLMKYISTTHCTWLTKEAMLLHGGNGILGNFSVIPRILNDSIINETWEGTHQVITEHVVKAIIRKKIRNEFFEMIQTNTSETNLKLNKLKEIMLIKISELKNILDENSLEYLLFNRISITEKIYEIFSLSELFSFASEEKFFLIALGYLELIQRNKNELVSKDSLFLDSESIHKIIY